MHVFAYKSYNQPFISIPSNVFLGSQIFRLGKLNVMAEIDRSNYLMELF